MVHELKLRVLGPLGYRMDPVCTVAAGDAARACPHEAPPGA